MKSLRKTITFPRPKMLGYIRQNQSAVHLFGAVPLTCILHMLRFGEVYFEI